MSFVLPQLRRFLLLAAGACVFSSTIARAAGPDVQPFFQKHCIDCHDPDTKKGNLDLSSLKFDPANAENFNHWTAIYDRVASGEMPPKKKARPDKTELDAFEKSLYATLASADQSRTDKEGRATQRRLNRYEYENALRDLLSTPWLQLRDALPEDREAFRFNKVSDALDVSHVQVARYMAAADSALHQVLATQVDRPATTTTRYYARDQKSFVGKMKFSVFNSRPERATFPVLGFDPQPDVRAGNAPMTVGKKDPKTRELEAVGVVASTYEPIEYRWDQFKAPVSGHYKLRINAYSVWAGPGKDKNWFIPDLDKITKGRRSEPVTVYSDIQPRLLRRLGAFDVTPEPGVHELDVELQAGETIRPDAARLFRSRPPAWHNPLAEADGCPGVAYRWLEVEGPIFDQWPTTGHQTLFGGIPLKQTSAGVEAVSTQPHEDAQRLLRAFLAKAYRQPAIDADVARFMSVIDGAMKTGTSFTESMIAGYTAVLCSPQFICLEEKPGKLDDYALASRLSFFLWNTAPDAELRQLAAKGKLHEPAALKAQTDRLLNDPKSRRFVDAFLDYWLDLRKINATSPDGGLYPDYYLDDLLVESAELETQSFFAELVKGNLPAKNLIASDFAMLNERLASHYGLPPVDGVDIRKVMLPKGSVRGGLMTQASVLKVTANGTTTSPVVRGAWVMERLLGKPPPPPPPSVPAVEPDTRGATTIRQQLEKHRTLETCGACHAKIDPPGLALESFDVMGGFREKYRAMDEKKIPEKKPTDHFGKNGQRFTFYDGPEVDPTGSLPGGGDFKDIHGLKEAILKDERQVARNLARQLTIYATGAPIRFGDRAAIEQMLDHTKEKSFGVRSLIHEVVESPLFLKK